MRQQALASATLALQQAGCDNAAQEAKWLWEHVSGSHWSEDLLSAETLAAFEQLIARRCTREPLAQILGHQPFWSLDFCVNKHTLIPRTDSEVVVEAALAYLSETYKPYRLLDLGTGTGCLLLTLLHERPNATGIGVDRSAEALAVAAQNAIRLKQDARSTWLQGDWATGINTTFDMLISNPPYIPEGDMAGLMPEVRDYEPHTALSAGIDGLNDYRSILAQAPALLNPLGYVVLELGIGQASAVKALAAAEGLKHIETRRDLGGIERAIVFCKN